MKTNATIGTPPAGTSGLWIKLWSNVYAVAANWSDAASPVWTYVEGVEDDWAPSGRQVADYQHSPRAALVDELGDMLAASGGDRSEADDLAAGATEF